MSRIFKLQKNTVGRDFVCGDLHGSYGTLTNFLKFVNFNTAADRLICTGDLIDRGPDSLSCLKLLDEDWFYSVAGNHEKMMQDYFFGGEFSHYWYLNGGEWGVQYKLNNSEEAQYVQRRVVKLPQLPLLISVEQQDGQTFHVIHAELHSDTVLSDADLADENRFLKACMVPTQNGPIVMWGRHMFQMLCRQELTPALLDVARNYAIENRHHIKFGPELSTIYSGHTILQSPVRMFGQVNLDTCAFKEHSPWCGLSVTEPLTGKFWRATTSSCREVPGPVTIAA